MPRTPIWNGKVRLKIHWALIGGASPTPVEVIPVSLDLPFASVRTNAWVLDETRQRKAELTVGDNGGKVQLLLNGATASVWYEIEVVAAN